MVACILVNVGTSLIIIQMEGLVKVQDVAQEQAESEVDFYIKGQRQGVWDEQQLSKFMVFTHFNKDIMCSKLQRRTLKIFKEMARFIDTRNSIQCRSQNQKLIKKHKSINKILKSYIESVGQEEFSKLCLSYAKHPHVKYIIDEPPPKELAGHAISISIQTEFSSYSGDESQQGQQGKHEQKNAIICSLLAQLGKQHTEF